MTKKSIGITQGVKLNPNVLSTYNGFKTENKL